MKKTKALLLLVAITITAISNTFAQYGKTTKQIPPYPVAVGTNKTVNLVFPFPIIGIDRGSSDIIVQTAKGAENILQVKADRRDFPETNITVVTSDASLYSFLVNYHPNPAILNLKLGVSDANGVAELEDDQLNAGELDKNSRIVAATKLRNKIAFGYRDGIKLAVDGLYISGEYLYYRLTITNTSNIGFAIDQLRFFIADKKKSKRTATQEIEQKEIFSFQNSPVIPAMSNSIRILVFPKYTLPDGKHMILQLQEKNGGRNIQLNIKSKKIFNARRLSN